MGDKTLKELMKGAVSSRSAEAGETPTKRQRPYGRSKEVEISGGKTINASGHVVKTPKGAKAHHQERAAAAFDIANFTEDPKMKDFAMSLWKDHVVAANSGSEEQEATRSAGGGGGRGSGGGAGGAGQRRHPKGSSAGGRFAK